MEISQNFVAFSEYMNFNQNICVFTFGFKNFLAPVCVTTVRIGLYLLINMLNHDEPLLCVQFIVKKNNLLTLRVKYEDTKVGHFSTH